MAIKPFEFLSNAVRAKEIVAVLARNGFADLLQKLDLPSRLLSALGQPVLHKRSQWERLRIVMEELGPTFVKVGQLLSMRPDVIPAPLIAELRKLQETVAAVPFISARAVVAEGLGRPVEEVFSEFEQEAAAAASMAQVHRARLRASGELVAVKVQRPGIERTIYADFDILLWFAKQAHERIDDLKPANLPAVVEALREGLEEELDFRREANSLESFARRNAFPEAVTAPRAYLEFSSRRLLVMQWIDGRRLSDVEAGSEEAKELARVGSRSLFHQILTSGYFHGDPHAGNVRVLDDGRLCFLDWGMVGQLTTRMRYGLVDLLMGFVRGDAARVARIALDLSDLGETIDRRALERDVNRAIREHYNPDTGEGDVGRAILRLLFVFGRYRIDLARDYSVMAKAILCVEETGLLLDGDYNLKEEFAPALRALMRERRNPRRLAGQLRDSLMLAVDQLHGIPVELARILKKIESDNLKVSLEHRGLGELDDTISDASNKITLGIILGCLLVGSSLIVTSNTPPIVFGFPILGIVGYVLSLVLGLYVAFDILRGRPK